VNAIFLALLQLSFQGFAHLLCRGQLGVVTTILIPTTFAINAVESANLTLFRQQIDSQRTAQTTAMDGTKNDFFSYHHYYFLITKPSKLAKL
jgi:hypothetical protein